MGVKLTVESVLALNPCSNYTKEYLEELFAGKESLTLREIMEHDSTICYIQNLCAKHLEEDDNVRED